jgi:hypothetical protein
MTPAVLVLGAASRRLEVLVRVERIDDRLE